MTPKFYKRFLIGDNNPNEITDWQENFVETYGNKPNLSVIIETTDISGSAVERDITDTLIERYYADCPHNTKLNRISFKFNQGETLDYNTTIIIKP